MCDQLAEFNHEVGNYHDAIKWIPAILEMDRCDEEAHRQLIRAFAPREGVVKTFRNFI